MLHVDVGDWREGKCLDKLGIEGDEKHGRLFRQQWDFMLPAAMLPIW